MKNIRVIGMTSRAEMQVVERLQRDAVAIIEDAMHRRRWNAETQEAVGEVLRRAVEREISIFIGREPR